MITNLFLFIILELASGFCQNLRQFLAVRALYGIAMGGLFGPAAATALEDLPYDARGVLSGFFELGYSMGYLLASAFYRALVPTTPHTWRSLFWFGAGPPVLIIAYRLWLPETNGYLAMAAEREARLVLEKQAGHHDDHEGAPVKAAGLRSWFKESWAGIKHYWVIFVYLIFLMTGWNSISHGVSLIFQRVAGEPEQATDKSLAVARPLPDLPHRPSRIRAVKNRDCFLRRPNRRHHWRNDNGLCVDVPRPASHYDDGVCYWRRLDPGVYTSPRHESCGRRVFYAVFRHGGMGPNTHPFDRACTASDPHDSCRTILPARESRLVRLFDH